MKLFKAIIVSAIILTASNVVMAQNQQAQQTPVGQQRQPKTPLTPELRADKMVEKMSKELSLTDDQKPKLRAIFVDKMQKRDAAMAKVNEDKKAMHEAMKTENNESEKDITTILDASQLAKYNKLRMERKAKMVEKRNAIMQEEEESGNN
jgi:protein CpxP